VAATVLLGSYVLVYHSEHGSYSPTAWGSRFFYARVGLYIDCDKLTLPADEQQVCPYGVPIAERTTNLFLWQTDAYLHRLVPPPGKSKDDVLSDFNRRALQQQPLAYIAVVARDSVRAFQPLRTTSSDDYFDWQWHVGRRHMADVNTAEARRLVAGGLMVRTWSAGRTVLKPYDWIQTPGPLLALLLALALASLLRARRGADQPRLPVAVCTAVSIVLIVGPAATVSFSWRYQVAQLVLIPLAGAIGLSQLLQRSDAGVPPEDPDEQDQLARSTAL